MKENSCYEKISCCQVQSTRQSREQIFYGIRRDIREEESMSELDREREEGREREGERNRQIEREREIGRERDTLRERERGGLVINIVVILFSTGHYVTFPFFPPTFSHYSFIFISLTLCPCPCVYPFTFLFSFISHRITLSSSSLSYLFDIFFFFFFKVFGGKRMLRLKRILFLFLALMLPVMQACMSIKVKKEIIFFLILTFFCLQIP